MKYKTLAHIHWLLLEAVEETRKEYKEARELQHSFENREERANAARQKEIANMRMKSYHDAKTALEDFERQEF